MSKIATGLYFLLLRNLGRILRLQSVRLYISSDPSLVLLMRYPVKVPGSGLPGPWHPSVLHKHLCYPGILTVN